MQKVYKNVSHSDIVFDIFSKAILLLILLIVVYPLYFVLIASITDPVVVNQGGLLLYPKMLYFGGYEKVFSHRPIVNGYTNSFIYMTLGTTINMLVTIPAAYALSRNDMYGRNKIMLLFTITMFFSGGLIPTYLVVKGLGLTDTIWALVLPNALSVWNLIVARTYFQNNIPDELLYAGRIDGVSDITFFIKIVLPISKAMIAVITLFYAVGHWNSYFQALIYINDQKMYPLQLVLRNLLILNTVAGTEMTGDARDYASKMRLAEQLKYAIIVVASLPLMLLYPFLQKYFVQGVMIGSLKG